MSSLTGAITNQGLELQDPSLARNHNLSFSLTSDIRKDYYSNAFNVATTLVELNYVNYS